MSFLLYREKIREKDTVILCRVSYVIKDMQLRLQCGVCFHQGYEKMFPVQVERGKVNQIKGGAVHHDALIGKRYGSKVKSFGDTIEYSL